MLTPDAVAEYVRSTQGIRSHEARTIAALWRQLPDDPQRAVVMLLDAMPWLVDHFAGLIEVAATDFYMTVRPSPSFTLPTFARPVIEQIQSSVRWAAAPLFAETPDNAAALDRLTASVDRNMVNHSFDVVVEAGGKDPLKPKYARVPVGETCAYCRLMASRGVVYRNEVTAQFKRSHAGCDCKVSPVFDGDELPYDPEPYYDEYQAARRKARSTSLKPILSAMRSADGHDHSH